jgi:CDP-diacylglycerol--serine O-phosphatidyltransferase
MKGVIKHIPNTITCLNLFSGCLSCVAAFLGEFQLASGLIILAAIFDFMDGFAARMLKAYSPMGKELDSLADMISFGLAPSFIVFYFLRQNLGIYFAIAAFIIPVFSALRLAKFNIDERQTSSFLGLPTPPNAIFWAFLVSSLAEKFAVPSETSLLISHLMVYVFIPIFSLLMVSEIPMFSLKIKSLSWKENKLRYFFLTGCLLLLFFLKISAFPVIIVFYIVLSLLNWAYQSIYVKSSKEV